MLATQRWRQQSNQLC